MKIFQKGIVLFLIYMFFLNVYANNYGLCLKKGTYFDENTILADILSKLVDVNHSLHNKYIHEYIAKKTYQNYLNTATPPINQSQIHEFIKRNPDCCQIYKGDELRKLYVEDLLPPDTIDSLLNIEFAVLKLKYQNEHQKSYIDNHHTQIVLFSIDRCGNVQYRKTYIWFF